jgi:hypothetical protein
MKKRTRKRKRRRALEKRKVDKRRRTIRRAQAIRRAVTPIGEHGVGWCPRDKKLRLWKRYGGTFKKESDHIYLMSYIDNAPGWFSIEIVIH